MPREKIVQAIKAVSGKAGKTLHRYRDPEVYKQHLLSCTEKSGDCLLFTGYISTGGYAMVRYKGKCQLAHYILWEMQHGKRPKGVHLDHTCHDPKICNLGKSCPHRRCINIKHLKIAAPKINNSVERSNGSQFIGIALEAAIALKKSRTHCPHGHEWSSSNTLLVLKDDGTVRQRACIACNRISKAKYKRKVRDAKRAIADGV